MPKKKAIALSGAAPRTDGTAEGINQSQIGEIQRCAYRWQLGFRRNIHRRGLYNVPMDRGTIVHAAIAAGLRAWHASNTTKLSNRALQKINAAVIGAVTAWTVEWHKAQDGRDSSPEELQQVEELAVTSAEIASRALGEMRLERVKILTLDGQPLIERKLSIPFWQDIHFYGTHDLVWKDLEAPRGIWVTDYKVRETFQPVEHEETDPQLPAYQHMLAKHGILTTGSMKIQIRAFLPRQPELTQKGAMSRKQITSTWETYKAALIAAKLNPADYEEEMRPKLNAEFFRADRIYRNQMMVNAMWDRVIVPMAKRSLRIMSGTSFPRSGMFLFRECAGCWARTFCLAELHGEDTEFLLDTDYTDHAESSTALGVNDFELEEA